MKSLSTGMKLIVESVVLNEGYEDRVQQAAQWIVGAHGDGEKIAKSEIVPLLKREREKVLSDKATGAVGYSGLKQIMPELALSNPTWNQAAKDIIAAISAGGYIKRAVAAPRAPYSVMNTYLDEKIPVTHEEIAELGQKLLAWAGDSFPDGDPNDRVQQWMERKDWDASDAYDKIMPIACKKYLGTKDYSEYLAQLWDDVHADSQGDENMLRSMGDENPWRSR